MSNTVKVRIAVVVDKCGNWKAYGNSMSTDNQRMNAARFLDERAARECFVEAELEFRAVETVRGSVSE